MEKFLSNNDKLLLDYMTVLLDNPGSISQMSKEVSCVRAAMQAFVNKPATIYKKTIQAARQRIQAVAVSTDFDLMTTNAFNVTIEEDNFDMGWEAAFRDVPRDADKDHWEIGTVVNGVTFRKVQEGQRIQVDGMTGDRVLAYVDYYGGAIGFTDKMIRFRKLAQMFDIASGFRNKFFANKADNHYAILAAAAAGNVIAYQGTGADTRIQRDILTLNLGAFTIGDVNKGKGYGDMANAPLLIYANPYDEDRIEAAFRAITADLVAGVQRGTAITRRPIRRIYTYNTNIVSGAPLLILPGRKIQKNDAMAPTTYVAPEDVLTLNRVQSVWAIYGAAIADTDQCYQLTLG